MPKRCLCGHDIGPTDEVTFQLNGKCKACHDRETAISLEQIRLFLSQTSITIDERIAAMQRRSEIEAIEKQIKDASRPKQTIIRAKDEYQL